METKEIMVIYAPRAKNSISRIATYIEAKGYPETAEKFAEKLYAFGNSLVVFPDKYPVCKQPRLATRKMRCAIFRKTYIFIYKPVRHTIVIYNIIHGSKNLARFSD